MVNKQIYNGKSSKIFTILIVIMLYIFILLVQPKRFYIWYPTIPMYPDNNEEIDIIVTEYIRNRTYEDIEFFKLTDSNPIDAFRGKISEEYFEKLNSLILSPSIKNKIMFYKLLYNRARPAQVAPDKIDNLYSSTANTAAYPSGHAFQGYYAAKLLSQWEPARKKEWDEIAERVAKIRVIAGLHYPSDNDFARQLVNKLNI
jgi:hypothetical protein